MEVKGDVPQRENSGSFIQFLILTRLKNTLCDTLSRNKEVNKKNRRCETSSGHKFFVGGEKETRTLNPFHRMAVFKTARLPVSVFRHIYK